MTGARSRAEHAAIAWEVQLRDPAHDERALRAFCAWHDGSPLRFDAASRIDLAEAFGRRHHDILRVGAGAASHVISGVFRLGDLDGALRQLAGALPVKVARYGLLTILE